LEKLKVMRPEVELTFHSLFIDARFGGKKVIDTEGEDVERIIALKPFCDSWKLSLEGGSSLCADLTQDLPTNLRWGITERIRHAKQLHFYLFVGPVLSLFGPFLCWGSFLFSPHFMFT
jgi:hypothetical protein